jgi:hypothetical protein
MDIGLLHKCYDQKNIRVKDIFFWNEQYLQQEKRNKMQTKLAMFEYLKLQAFIMHFCMIRLRKYIRH